MGLENHFLPEDWADAMDELNCTLHCLTIATNSIEQGDYQMAIVYHENLLRSIKELKRLNDRKKRSENLHSMISELSKTGVKVMVLRVKGVETS